jgi:V8-like Glu-specific endopeptidase
MKNACVLRGEGTQVPMVVASRFPLALGGIVLVLSSACGRAADDEEPDSGMVDPKASGASAEAAPAPVRTYEQARYELVDQFDWESLGLESPELIPLGPVTVTDGAAMVEQPNPDDDPGPPEGQASLAFVAVDVPAAFAYKLQFKQSHFNAISTLADPSPGQAIDSEGRAIPDHADPGLEQSGLKAWSNGTDTRIRRAEADGFAENLAPINRIGMLSSGCTGAFIGRKMILTAAHCVLSSSGAGNANVWDRNGELANDWDLVFTSRSAWVNNNFYPRLDQNTTATAYASVKAEFYLTPLEYSNGTCTNITNCNRYDFAMILTSGPNPAGVPAGGANTHPGFFGWRTAADSWYSSNTLSFRGYPGCGTGTDWTRASRPGGWNSATCTAATLYGDTQACTGSSGSNPIQGFSAEFWENCDGSPGMSGAPFYDSGNHIVGVYSQESCAGNPGNPAQYNTANAPSCVGVATPGQFTTITPDRANLITVYRNTTWNNWP